MSRCMRQWKGVGSIAQRLLWGILQSDCEIFLKARGWADNLNIEKTVEQDISLRGRWRPKKSKKPIKNHTQENLSPTELYCCSVSQLVTKLALYAPWEKGIPSHVRLQEGNSLCQCCKKNHVLQF